MKSYYTYITTNPGRSALYTGVTSDLARRIWQHYLNRGKTHCFAGKYYCYNLIYFEEFYDIHQAIFREKEIKNMSREKKIALIDAKNPGWKFIRPW